MSLPNQPSPEMSLGAQIPPQGEVVSAWSPEQNISVEPEITVPADASLMPETSGSDLIFGAPEISVPEAPDASLPTATGDTIPRVESVFDTSDQGSDVTIETPAEAPLPEPAEVPEPFEFKSQISDAAPTIEEPRMTEAPYALELDEVPTADTSELERLNVSDLEQRAQAMFAEIKGAIQMLETEGNRIDAYYDQHEKEQTEKYNSYMTDLAKRRAEAHALIKDKRKSLQGSMENIRELVTPEKSKK